MAAVLVVALILQFAQKRYVPWAYWLAVVLISIVGTLVTDNLVDNFGVRLETTTIVFSVALAATFAVWYAGRENPVDPHHLHDPARELSTGWRSSSPSRSAPPRGISSPKSSSWAI